MDLAELDNTVPGQDFSKRDLWEICGEICGIICNSQITKVNCGELGPSQSVEPF